MRGLVHSNAIAGPQLESYEYAFAGNLKQICLGQNHLKEKIMKDVKSFEIQSFIRNSQKAFPILTESLFFKKFLFAPFEKMNRLLFLVDLSNEQGINLNNLVYNALPEENQEKIKNSLLPIVSLPKIKFFIGNESVEEYLQEYKKAGNKTEGLPW